MNATVIHLRVFIMGETRICIQVYVYVAFVIATVVTGLRGKEKLKTLQ